MLKEELGMAIDAVGAKRFADKLHELELPMHSIILLHKGKVIFEAYQEPYGPDTLHRMYSISKSLVGIAIGFLEQEGKISLSDHIIKYFPEKLPKEVHPYIEAMTIEDMMNMKTCHHRTTYKLAGCEDWVGSFFTTAPSHYPGTFFSYDTSSAHVMGALVEKLTGMELLDYLRSKVLDQIGFSKEAYFLKDPMGVSIGGSGLMAKPRDILKLAKLLMDNGRYNGEMILPEKYIKSAFDMPSATYGFGQAYEEMQGYGYQMWRSTQGGYMFYGLGGQYALWFPKKELILVTTADVQGRKEGMQEIFTLFRQEVLDNLEDGTCPEPQNVTGEPFSDIKEKTGCLDQVFLTDRCLPSMTCENQINGVVFNFDDACKNDCGFSHMKLVIGENAGQFEYTYEGTEYVLNFGRNRNELTMFPKYNHRALVSGAWQNENTFLVYAQIIDEYIGKVFFNFSFKEDHVGIAFRKIEESFYKEFELYGSGTLQRN